MAKIEYFFVEESMSMPGYYFIKANHELLHLERTLGSYNLLQARLFEISYADYLRLCRDSFGAKIIGKNTYYPVAYFKDKLMVNGVKDLLNARAAFVIWNREHPDYTEHEKFVEDWHNKIEATKERNDEYHGRNT